MADGPSILDQLAQRNAFSQSGSQGAAKDITQQDPIELLKAAADKASEIATKLSGGLIPNNLLGSVSITQPFDRTESWVDKPINQTNIARAEGGLLYKAIAWIMKNREITDQTGGVGGDVTGGGAVASIEGAPIEGPPIEGSPIQSGSYGDAMVSNASFADLGGFAPTSFGGGQGGGRELG